MSRISRDNYEEYFLLYSDNELSPAEKSSVDEFVRDNPDLRGELMMLFQLKVQPDQGIAFDQKDILFRKEDGHVRISRNNCEEFFLLYADEELSPEQKKMVEEFVQGNISLQKELEVIMRTRIEPAEIKFPNKDILYRRKEKRFVLVPWMRIAAAAVFILAIGLLFLFKSGMLSTEITVARTKPFNDGRAGHVAARDGSVNKLQQAVTSPSRDSFNIAKTTGKRASVNKSVKKPIERKEKRILFPQDPPQREVAMRDPDSSDEVVAAAKINRSLEKMDNPAVHEIAGPLTASGTTLFDALSSSGNRILIVEDDPGDAGSPVDPDNTSAKKNKFRGFFRKVSRAFNKTAHVDSENSDAILIGSFRVALK
jgi:hypothetical protein